LVDRAASIGMKSVLIALMLMMAPDWMLIIELKTLIGLKYVYRNAQRIKTSWPSVYGCHRAMTSHVKDFEACLSDYVSSQDEVIGEDDRLQNSCTSSRVCYYAYYLLLCLLSAIMPDEDDDLYSITNKI